MRWGLLFGLAAAWAGAAMAQTAPQNGLGPYHFEMNVAQAQATAPRAQWRVETISPTVQALSGGPRVSMGARFDVTLMFEQSALRLIVLTAQADGSCNDVIPSLIEHLEPTYGAFDGAAGQGEAGAVQRVSTTTAGSQVRFRDNQNVYSSNRRQMFIQVAGQPQANNPGICNISVTFNAHAPESPAPYVPPTGSTVAAIGFFDLIYRDTENRQHLGVDFMADAGANVVAPVAGEIVTNDTSSNARDSYIVIRTAEGVEHVLGHIASTLAVGAHVEAGQVVGTVLPYPGPNPLTGRDGYGRVHWGINRLGVAQALRGDWDWNEGPRNSSRNVAERRGWVSP